MEANDNPSPPRPVEGEGGDGQADDFDDPEKVRKRQEQALMFEKYLEETGLSLSFQIIFTEII